MAGLHVHLGRVERAEEDDFVTIRIDMQQGVKSNVGSQSDVGHVTASVADLQGRSAVLFRDPEELRRVFLPARHVLTDVREGGIFFREQFHARPGLGVDAVQLDLLLPAILNLDRQRPGLVPANRNQVLKLRAVPIDPNRFATGDGDNAQSHGDVFLAGPGVILRLRFLVGFGRVGNVPGFDPRVVDLLEGDLR